MAVLARAAAQRATRLLFIDAGEQAIGTASTAQAPWTIVEGRDEQYRSLTVAESLRQAIEQRLSERALPPRRRRRATQTVRARAHAPAAAETILCRRDMSKRLEKRTFERELLKCQGS